MARTGVSGDIQFLNLLLDELEDIRSVEQQLQESISNIMTILGGVRTSSGNDAHSGDGKSCTFSGSHSDDQLRYRCPVTSSRPV